MRSSWLHPPAPSFAAELTWVWISNDGKGFVQTESGLSFIPWGINYDADGRLLEDYWAIFCYDLMNEPVVPSGDRKRDEWLGTGFGYKHFVQFIALERKRRNRPDVARDWIRTLTTPIRRHDKRHLITVGLVPWGLDRLGMTSGFDPEKIADDLDFIAMHIYPEKGKIDAAIETVKGFAAVGKPVVIEETFVLKCGGDELDAFIDRSQEHATGWIGCY